MTLEDILVFATGSDTEPPLGFPVQPTLEFIHEPVAEGIKKFPRANTCGLVLHLPIVDSYDAFTSLMEEGVTQSPTFGQL